LVNRRRFIAAVGALALRDACADVAYPDVVLGVALAFPRDEGAHPAFRNEWWYVTGWLRDSQGRDLGFQVTFFRNRPGVAEASTSAFAPRQLLFAHAAIADPAIGRLVVDELAAREGFRLAYADSGHTDVAIGRWSLAQRDETFTAGVHAREFTLELVLVARQPPLLQGDRGVSRKGPQAVDASYYYSRPQLQVHGKLARAGEVRDVTGVAWLDHEWSSRYLAQGSVGWDWTGLDFDDGGALMAFRIRDRHGSTLWAGGSYRDASGRTQTFARDEIAFVATRRWRSPRTRIEYPVAFILHAGEFTIALEPLMPDQELDARGAIGVVYWEGAMRASVDGRVVAHGYVELTGYGEPLRI
jgi:predicted secreted hydrolase